MILLVVTGVYLVALLFCLMGGPTVINKQTGFYIYERMKSVYDYDEKAKKPIMNVKVISQIMCPDGFDTEGLGYYAGTDPGCHCWSSKG